MIVGQPYLQPSRGNHGCRFTARILVHQWSRNKRIYNHRAATMVDGLPRAFKCMVHMVVGFVVSFSFFENIMFASRFQPATKGVIHKTCLMLQNAWVAVLELTHRPFPPHSWFTWWSGFLSDLEISDSQVCAQIPAGRQRGVIHGHSCRYGLDRTVWIQQCSLSDRRQNDQHHGQDYLYHRDPSIDHNFIIGRQIGISFCQNL